MSSTDRISGTRVQKQESFAVVVNRNNGVEFVLVVNWQTRTRWELPRFGEGSYLRWLVAQGYELMEQQPLGMGEIEIYQLASSKMYAVYISILVELDVECLLVEIPTPNEVREIITNVRQRW